MSRTKTLVVTTLLLVGSTVAGIGTVPAAAQTDDGPVVTVEVGALEGATLCAQQVATDTNRLIVRDAAYEDITIYLDETRRIELEQTRSNATIVLHTDREEGPVDRLADLGDCLTANRTDAVVTANAITTHGLSVERYVVEVGTDSAVPDANGFGIDVDEPDNESEDDGPVENVTDPVTEPINDTGETVDDAINETEAVLDETVNETDDRLEEAINETDGQLEETVNETGDQLEETADETGDQLEETVDETGDFLRETTAETTGALG